MQSTYTLGITYFELSNHLDNPDSGSGQAVLMVVTDCKLGQPNGNVGISYYRPDVVSSTDYFPLGYAMDNRSFSSDNYRYAYSPGRSLRRVGRFNGKEKDPEGMGGGGSTYDYGFRIFNSSIGRFLNVDPLSDKYPSTSPYMNTAGNPVILVDPKGLAPERTKVGKFLNKSWDFIRGHGWEEGSYSGTFYGKQRKLDAKSVANLTTGSFVSKKEYIKYWKKTHAVKMKKAQRKVVPDGCIGLVRADTGTPHDKKPNTSHSYDNLESAEEYAESLPKGQRVVIFALEFATDKPDRYKGNEKTHRVLIKSQKIYNNSFYNYYLFDPYSGMWWGQTKAILKEQRSVNKFLEA